MKAQPVSELIGGLSPSARVLSYPVPVARNIATELHMSCAACGNESIGSVNRQNCKDALAATH
jgi:hypothetical protein